MKPNAVAIAPLNSMGRMRPPRPAKRLMNSKADLPGALLPPNAVAILVLNSRPRMRPLAARPRSR
jgi:hypothetical protein